MKNIDTARELRAEIARRQVPIYVLAARVGLHPGRLGMMLRGRIHLTDAYANKIKDALEGQ